MRVVKWLFGVVTAILLLGAGTIVAASLMDSAKAPERTAGGEIRAASIYLTMSDGVRIAADVVLPKDLAQGAKAPVLIKGTPYWRGMQLSFIGRAMRQLGMVPDLSEGDVEQLSAHGYALLLVDTRGTGASFGHVGIILDDREVADFGEIIDWAAKQPWSNGRVGAYGFSYRGLLATGAASLGKPALKAIAPTFDFSDLYLTMRPGGVLADPFIKSWGSFTAALNRGEAPWCNALMCRLMLAGPKRVDADQDGSLLAAAIAEHAKNWNVYECAKAAISRDDKVCVSGRSFGDVSELADRAAIEQSGLPMLAFVGYFDSNSAQLALARYATFANPQTVVMGAISHGGFMSTDPFVAGAKADPTPEAQTEEMARFFDRYLKADEKPSGKTIRYLVLNGGGWRETDHWPPSGAVNTTWYLGADHALTATRPTEPASDNYTVDFTASSGKVSRYVSPVDLSQTDYPDRASQDKKLLTYTSEPLTAATAFAGSPLATLTIGTAASDGVIIVYLERVAADGSITYLSEGVLRLMHRKLADAGAISGDAHHSYLSADASPWATAEVAPIVIELNPIAVRLNQGDRLRVAIAGADADNLERIPADGGMSFGVIRGAAETSRIEIPQLSIPSAR